MSLNKNKFKINLINYALNNDMLQDKHLNYLKSSQQQLKKLSLRKKRKINQKLKDLVELNELALVLLCLKVNEINHLTVKDTRKLLLSPNTSGVQLKWTDSQEL